MLLLFKACNGEDLSTTFRLEKENGSIENYRPLLKENVTTEIQCFLSALQYSIPVCFIQTIFTEESMSWICLFFGFEESAFQVIERTNSKVYVSQKQLQLL